MPDEQPPPKTIDVTKPGAPAPEPSAKPIIVSNRPMLQDPMMVKSDDKPPHEQKSDHKELSATGKTIPSPAGLTAPKAEPPSPAPTPPTEAKDSSEPEPETAQASSEKAVVDAVASKTAGGDKKKTEVQAEAEKTQQEHLEKLVEDKTYFLPIGKVTQRKQNKQVLIVAGAVAVLGLVFFLLK